MPIDLKSPPGLDLLKVGVTDDGFERGGRPVAAVAVGVLQAVILGVVQAT